MTHLMVTWPKSRTLESYLEQLRLANTRCELVNFRIPTLPSRVGSAPLRCYMVHDGFIRGYTWVKEINWLEDGEVKDVVTGGYWPEGYYIVRYPAWYSIVPERQKGFQGYRYIERDYD